MSELTPDHEIVFKSRGRAECLESRLVLRSVGIPATAIFQEGWWLLIVSSSDLTMASEELEAYRQENAAAPTRTTKTPIYGGALAGVTIYAGVVMLVAVLNGYSAFGWDWLPAGRMQAGLVMAGQWWRTVTALTLHLDAGHISANLVFGTVFGLLAGRVLGGGVAWLAIVIAGALGNFINAMVQAPTHASIGASTAVFAALGVIVSHSLRPRTSVQEKPLKRWSPLIAGIVLLGFTGVGGENTDVVAHVTGFFAGLLIGWAGSRLPNRWLASTNIQLAAGLTTVGIVILTWVIALAAAR
jgi:membrane associated rhomboid family serine protease